MNSLYEFDAIGTHWWIEIVSRQQFSAHLKKTIDNTAEQFNQRYSRFREDSLVSELFRTKRLSNPPAEMVRMLEFAKEMHAVSEGAFDSTVGNTLHRFGYGKRSIARSVNLDHFWDEIVITPAEIILPEYVMLDFGGFGKGWLIDQLVRDMKLAGIREFIVNGGGDLYVQAKEPILFKLEDPYDTTTSIGNIKIQQGALAGSNTLKRTWEDSGKIKHHIIDPHQQDSSDTGVVASYVAASSATIADTMATILILRPELDHKLAKQYRLKTKLVSC